MSDCMEFGDHLEGGVHDAVRENTSATDWARAKVRIIKSLGQLGGWRALQGLWVSMGRRISLWTASLDTP